MKLYNTKEELMEYFGIGKNTVTKWEREGLRFIDMGEKTHFYKSEDIVAFLDDRRRSLYTRA